MTRLSPTQVRALNHAAQHGGISPADGFTRATIGVLQSFGLMKFDHITSYDTWTAHLTPSGQAWILRNSPERQAENARNMELRTEYRQRAAKYLASAKNALQQLSYGNSAVDRAIKQLELVAHPAKSPARVEDAGWWLTDNNVSGWAYEIGCALRDIGENCGRTTYQIDGRALDRLVEYEDAIASYWK